MRKKCPRQEVITTDVEVEEVNDKPIAKPLIEEVNDVNDEQPEQSNEDEVSTYHHIMQRMSQLTEQVLYYRTGLMTINMGLVSKKNY